MREDMDRVRRNRAADLETIRAEIRSKRAELDEVGTHQERLTEQMHELIWYAMTELGATAYWLEGDARLGRHQLRNIKIKVADEKAKKETRR